MPALDHPLIDQFLDALWLEKGLSDNTRVSYRSDLALFNGWLQEHSVSLPDAGRDLILDHLAWRLDQGYKPRSTARFLSGLRGFFRYLLREKLVAIDPTLQVDMPQLGKPLPKSLSEADVEALLQAPDLGEAIGQRDRAMLEVLYACGLRVTELVSLTLDQVNLRQGVLRVMGKGSKERLVPMGEEAVVWLERYQRDGRAELLNGRPSDVLFPTCSTTVPTCGWYRCCWATVTCRPRRSIPTSPRRACSSCTPSTTRVDECFSCSADRSLRPPSLAA